MSCLSDRPIRLTGRMIARMTSFGRAETGVAAVEFALILPVMITMYLGMTELTVGINTDRKLTLLSRTLADLTSRVSKIDTAGIGNVFNAASAVMQPYSASKVAMTVTSVLVAPGPSGKPVGTVDWSCTRGPSPVARAKGSTYPVPQGFETSQSFILVETSLNYAPMFGGRFIGSSGIVNLGQTTPWPVRDGTQVTWQGSACT